MLEEGSFMATGGLVGVAVSHLPRNWRAFHGVANSVPPGCWTLGVA